MERKDQIRMFHREFNLSIYVEHVYLDIHEDDGYGNSHLKGTLELNNGLYGKIEFDIKRENRIAINPSVKLFDKEIPFIDHNSDERKNGIRDESNIMISFMNYTMSRYEDCKPFGTNNSDFGGPWYMKNIDEVEKKIKAHRKQERIKNKKWYQFWIPSRILS